MMGLADALRHLAAAAGVVPQLRVLLPIVAAADPAFAGLYY